MPKITIEFNLPDEERQYRCAADGQKYCAILYELDQHLRKTTKYGASIITTNGQASDVEIQVAEHIRSYLHNYLLTEYNVTLEER